MTDLPFSPFDDQIDDDVHQFLFPSSWIFLSIPKIHFSSDHNIVREDQVYFSIAFYKSEWIMVLKEPYVKGLWINYQADKFVID